MLVLETEIGVQTGSLLLIAKKRHRERSEEVTSGLISYRFTYKYLICSGRFIVARQRELYPVRVL